MAIDLPPTRHRAETKREQDLQMELAARLAEDRDFVARITPLGLRLYGMATFVSPAAEQTAARLVYETNRFRKQVAE